MHAWRVFLSSKGTTDLRPVGSGNLVPFVRMGSDFWRKLPNENFPAALRDFLHDKANSAFASSVEIATWG